MSDITIVAGRTAIPGPAMVTTDQETILGNGTQGDPIRAPSTQDVFDASFVPDLPLEPRLGMVVTLIDEAPDPGPSPTVKPADAGVDGAPQGVGLIVEIDDSMPVPTVTVQTSRIVQLTTGQWDAVAGGRDGLTPAAVYYLSATSLGGLTTTPPASSGMSVAQIGVALNASSLLLSTPATPRQNA